MAIRFGVSRGIFSNEAGLGSSPIAHAAAKTNNQSLSTKGNTETIDKWLRKAFERKCLSYLRIRQNRKRTQHFSCKIIDSRQHPSVAS